MAAAVLAGGCGSQGASRSAAGERGPALAANAATPPPAALPPLEAGRSQRGELAGGERRVYQLHLDAGDYARIYVEQRLSGDPGIDLVATLLAPDGSRLDESDTPGGVRGGEQLSLVAPADGVYRLVLAAVSPDAPRGRYQATLEERRPAVAGDQARVGIERLINDASNLRLIETEEADDRALAKLEVALRLSEAAGDAGHAGDALTLMGDVALARGRYAEASDRYRNALTSYQHADDRPGQAMVLGNLGLVSRRTGDVGGALDGYRKALAMWTELGNTAEQANALHNMAMAARASGNLDQASEWLREALRLQHRAGSLDGEAKTLNALADLELLRGEIDSALEDAGAALEKSRQAGARSTEAYCLNSLAGIQRMRGDLQAALGTYLAALGLNRQRGAAGDEATVLDNLGVLYTDLGEQELAQESLQQALDLYSSLGIPGGQIDALCHLGAVQAKFGTADAAVEYFQRALPLSRQLGSPLPEALTRQWLGSSLLALGRSDEATAQLERAVELQGGARDRAGEAISQLELGSAHAARGDGEAARRHLERALELSVDLDFRLAESRTRLRLAAVEREEGDLPGALAETEKAVDIYEDLRSAVAGDRLRTSFFSRSREFYEFYVDLLMEMDRRDPGGGFAARAFAVSERARARGLLDLLAEGRIELSRGISPDLKAADERVDRGLAATQELLSRPLAEAGGEQAWLAELQRKLADLEGERRRLDERIRRESPRYAELRSPTPLGLMEVQHLLAADQALLEFSLGAAGSHLFVVTRSTLATYPLPPAGELRDRVARLREAVISRERRALGAYVVAARDLYQALIAPAEPVLSGKTNLLIAPDGALYYLSFEALLATTPVATAWSELPYLLRERTLSYVPSASVLASLAVSAGRSKDDRRDGEPEKQFVAFADPDYRGGEASASAADSGAEAGVERLRGSRFEGSEAVLPRLTESAREVEEIAARFGADRSALYLGEEATESNVKDNPFLGRADWVHFATHGLIDEVRPERSGLLLTPSPDSGDPTEDGVLRVGEVFNLDLSADLVVLSACDTGLGKEVSGEGLVGLTRAFLYAGSPSVVVSLWEVEDRSTAALMVSLKRHLDEGLDKAAALRLAKLDLIRPDGAPEPRLWAPFVLVGQARSRAMP